MAHRTGEPFGTLVLAVAVTIIEVALIVSVMVAAPAEKAGLARDTVFAAVMIVCNGIVSLCLLWGGARHHEQGFQVHGASAALAVLAALTTLTLILPNVTTTVPGPLFSIPLCLENPKIGRAYDAEVVSDRIAEDRPVFRYLLAQEM